MTREEVFEKIQKILMDYLGPEVVKDLSVNSDLKADLGMDSMDILYVAFETENAFNVRFEDGLLETFTTVSSLVDVVMLKLTKN